MTNTPWKLVFKPNAYRSLVSCIYLFLSCCKASAFIHPSIKHLLVAFISQNTRCLANMAYEDMTPILKEPQSSQERNHRTVKKIDDYDTEW